jgi:peroxiredoxin
MADTKIKAGDKLPDATLRRMTEKGPEAVKTTDFFKGRKVVVFAVPGAFTPTCHNDHLPSYTKNAATFKTKGVAEVACIAINDPFVLAAWAKSVPGADKVTFLSDGNGEFTKAIGMTFDGSGFGLGTRSRRYAMVVEDGRVKSIDVEENPGACSISSGPSILKKI